MPRIVHFVALTACLWAPGLVAALGATPTRPNVVFILMDDLGWADVGCYGSEFHQTPNIDRLASQGMRFTDAYAACNCCSPTRASILTGKYPARLHLTDWIPGSQFPKARLRPPEWLQELPLEETTLAEALKASGYTSAAVGKWHLGKSPFLPQNQGFDVSIAGNHSGAPGSYFWPYGHNDPARANRYHGGPVPDVLADGRPGEYLTDRLTDEALRFIEANRQRPFFLYLAHYAVHTPLQAKPELIEKHRARLRPDLKQNNPTYAAMVESMDQSVGRVMEKLDTLGIAERTIVFFTSDNGGYSGYGGKPGGTCNAPLRDGKGSAHEGGHRVPLVIRWPGVARAGSVCREPVTSVDFYPTILAMAGAPGEARHNAAVDGVDLSPLLKQEGKLARDAIYWHYPHYNVFPQTPYGAVRQGDYKLIEFDEDQRVELYDLRSDLGETTNLAARMPELVAALRSKLAAWRKSVGAQMAIPNSDHDPVRTKPSAPRPRSEEEARTADSPWQEPVDVAFTARCDGSTERYVVMLPKGLDTTRPVDLLVALHGHGSDRWQFIRSPRDECRALRDVAARCGMIYVSPDYRAKTSWMGPKAEADVLQILEAVREKYPIRHTFLCGGSMGGSSALTFAALHPDRVDGVVALNGTANHVEYANFQDAIAQSFGGSKAQAPEEYQRRSAELQAERLTMPLSATVGGKDTSVPPDSVRRLMRGLQAQGRRVLLIDRPDRGHWTDYADTEAALRFVVDAVRGNDTRAGRRSIALPESCNTPDAMAVLADGTIILSVPNFTDPTSPGVLMRISPQDEVALWCKLPPHPDTGHAYPMGVRQAPSGDLYVADCQCMDKTPDNSRLLCVRVVDGKPGPVEVVARGLNEANGVAIRDGFVYVTDSATGAVADGAVVSAVYRFRLDERDVPIRPGGRDPHLVATQKTFSKAIPVGADGIDFDDEGNLYVANCGDAVIEKIDLDATGKVVSQKVITPVGAMQSADGMFYDRRTKRLYVADILANAIRAVGLNGSVETVAQDADNDGSAGQLDGPSEAVVRGDELIVANFDRVFPGCVNTKPDKPYTLSVLKLSRPTNTPQGSPYSTTGSK